MTEFRIDQALEELVPPFEAGDDGWADVLTRARGTRRRFAVAGAAILALVLVPTSLALRTRIVNLFHGTPAPPAIAARFENMAPPVGFGQKYPHADVSQAHGVLEVQTSDGPEDLWAAPDNQGGQCWWIDWANDPGQYGFGGCDVPSSGDIDPAVIWVEPHAALATLWGRVYVPADRVVATLQSGESLGLPVVEGGFLASLDRGDRLERATAYEGDREVASWQAP